VRGDLAGHRAGGIGATRKELVSTVRAGLLALPVDPQPPVQRKLGPIVGPAGPQPLCQDDLRETIEFVPHRW
jgi:hypothetical protein